MGSTARRLSLAEARRVALAAQGFGRPSPASVGIRRIQSVIDDLALFQIDSVNVLARAHLMPLFSRLGAYDPQLLDRCAQQAPRRLFEYWGHAACLIDVRLEPALRFRQLGAASDAWPGLARWAREHPAAVEAVYERLACSPTPMTARELESPEPRVRDQWGWNWSDAKSALEWLLWSGRVSVAGRNRAFERRYDLIERVIPDQRAAEGLDEDEGVRVLVARAARSLGIAGVRCLADYFRTSHAATRRAVAALERSGELIRTQVEGWAAPAWMWHRAVCPRRVEAVTLVSPFDPLVFERKRLLALFGFDYRIEIYTPAASRRYGYYVLPFLLDEALVARFDLAADRARGRLVVAASWLEPDAEPQAARVAARAGAHLEEVASWLGLSDICVEPRGDLSSRLAATLG